MLQHTNHFVQCSRWAQALQTHGIDVPHHGSAIALRQGFNHLQHIALVNRPQHLAHCSLLQLACTKGNGLVSQAQRIAHRTSRKAPYELECSGIMGNMLLRQHMVEMRLNGLGQHGPQVELQAAAQHRHGYFLRVGGGQHKLQIFRRLFQRFEHRVKRGVGEHVHFVNHEHLKTPLHRLVNRLLEQGLHLVHPPIRGRVELGVVDKTAAIDVLAGLAHTAGLGRNAALPVGTQAIERLGQNARHRGFAHPARARKQVGMVQPLRSERVAQSLNHMLLPHHIGEGFGAVFAGQDNVRHARILSVTYNDP